MQRHQLTRFDEHGQRRLDTAGVSVDGIRARDLNPFFAWQSYVRVFFSFGACAFFGAIFLFLERCSVFFVQADVSENGIFACTLVVLVRPALKTRVWFLKGRRCVNHFGKQNTDTKSFNHNFIQNISKEVPLPYHGRQLGQEMPRNFRRWFDSHVFAL